jgi:hypothetical protein
MFHFQHDAFRALVYSFDVIQPTKDHTVLLLFQSEHRAYKAAVVGSLLC